MKFRTILMFVLALALVACNKEVAALKLTITPSSLDINSGETIDFAIGGTSEFLVYYSGLDGQVYDEYPNAAAESINMQAATPSFSKTYNYHGTVKAVFVANSFGNWSDDHLDQVFEFTIKITDNNTILKSLSLKTPGLFGEKYDGVIDTENATVTVTIPQGTTVTNLTTNAVPDSPLSIILLEGSPFSNNSSLDFSATGSKIFTVESIGGAEKEWTVNIDFQ